jgi:uncharacterized protein (DUF1800 family)
MPSGESSSFPPFTPPVDSAAGRGQPTRKDAARFLMQATLGATTEDIAEVCALGFEPWIDAQFRIPTSIAHEEVYRHIAAGIPYQIHHAWWRQILTGKDLLRQRMAMALSEIFVISEVSLNFVAWEVMEYYDDLAQMAFGHWRELLKAVSMDPLMGHYLSHLRNRKADPALQRYPDENSAREVMQLFSIGLWELNEDGTRRVEQGREIPTYDNTAVTNFARVFTGLGFGGPLADANKPEDFLHAPPDYSNAMKLWEGEHDQDEKVLLRGVRLPAFAGAPGRRAIDDIDDAMDNLFHHPNVGPFFGRLLIQRLVTSNPSPGYVRRVATAFADNGRGERGDMKAVIKAILLDPEARNPAANSVTAGRLREPYLRYVRLARTFKARSQERSFKINDHNTLLTINQSLLNAPSVFNFFLPDYQPPGPLAAAGLYAPEFQIMTSSTAITSVNRYNRMIGDGFGEIADDPGIMRLSFEEELEVADDPEALIDLLDLKMACGALSEETKQILLTAYREMPADASAETRVKMIAQLISLSPDFAVLQ